VVLVLFPACQGLLAPVEGTVVLNLPGPAAPEGRAALVDAVLNGLRYVIHCEGPGSTKDLTVEGGGTVSIGLAAGRWHISVEAEYRDISAGRGEGDVEVRAGASNTADITMSPTEEFGAPVITGEPRDAMLLPAVTPSVSLKVEAVSFFQGPLSYQWYKNSTDSTAGGEAISGADGLVYMPPNGTAGTTYYYVEITGANNRTRASETAKVTVMDPVNLSIGNAKTAEGGAYGVGEPFQYQVMATWEGTSYDVTSQVSASDLGYDFTTAGSKPVAISNSSLLGFLSGSPVFTATVKTLAQRVAEANTAGGSHTLLVYGNESMSGVSSANIDNADITLKSSDETTGGMRNMDLTGTNVSMFYIYGSGAKLTLDRNITLNGISGNDVALVRVESSGELVMEADSLISGNTNTSTTNYGGGVYVYGNGAKFTMNGGTISDNEANNGGGVYKDFGGFDMNGGVISNNEAATNGGGVYVSTMGYFVMSGGTISGNTAATNGGGVYITNALAAFDKTGGVIYGDNDITHSPGDIENTAGSGNGHAVYTSSSPVKKRNGTAGSADDLFVQIPMGMEPLSYEGGWD
jgi:hypothetical protein